MFAYVLYHRWKIKYNAKIFTMKNFSNNNFKK